MTSDNGGLSGPGVPAEELPSIKAGILALAAAEELAAIERASREEIDRLSAKPWRGACPCCPGMMWCTDTEEEAGRLVTGHIAERHVILPQVWQDH